VLFSSRLGHNLMIHFHRYTGVRNEIGISQFRFLQIIQQSFLYIVYKFGEIWFSNPGVNDLKMCTVGVEYFTGIILATFARRRHC